MPRGHKKKNYVLPLAIVLVVGQIAAFVAIKLTRSDDKPAAPQIAAADSALGATPSGSGAEADVTPTGPGSAIAAVIPADAVPAPPPEEAKVEPDPTPAPPDETEDDGGDRSRESSKQKAAREKAAREKAAKDKLEREKAEKAEKEREAKAKREAEEQRRRDAEARRQSDAEKARLAAEAEKARIERAKAEAAAEAARLEAERLRAEREKQAAAAKAKGSSSVLVLVLGPGTGSPGSEAIKNVYMGKSSVWPNGTTARPMNRPSGSAAGKKFFSNVLGVSAGTYREHWSGLQLGGGGISPPTISSASHMIGKVAATRGAIGYVLESELPENTAGVNLVRLK